MKVKIIIERGNDGHYSAYMDNDKLEFGLNGQGKSANEALMQLKTAYKEIREMLIEEGKKVPDLEFEYHYDVDSFLSYYSGILSKSGLEKITGIHQKQLWHYSTKDIEKRRTPERATVLRIQEGLRKFGEELSRVKLID